MLGASEVQIRENNLDNLKLTRDEDGKLEIVDPQCFLGFEMLEGLDPNILDSLLKSRFCNFGSPTLAIYFGVASPLATRKVHVHGLLKTTSTLSTLNIGLVNPFAPRKGKFHGGLITISTLYT
ncbi:hypothetical protein Tco_0469442 [Tanacetum coccineum]